MLDSNIIARWSIKYTSNGGKAKTYLVVNNQHDLNYPINLVVLLINTSK